MKKLIKTFFASDIAVGICLMVSTAAALALCNSPQFPIYEEFFATEFLFGMNLRHFINDFLMAIFFLLVGLELKKEILLGELSEKKKIALPLIAACGGVIAPIIIYYFFNHNSAENIAGFAIPCATDIAFVYGAIALFGKRISPQIRIFVVALAIIDDLIAILIIAFFYSHNIDFTYIWLGLMLLCALALMNYFSLREIYFYLIAGFFLWLVVLRSGIHASLAGALLAAFIPLKINSANPLETLAKKIAPMVNFLILPLFAFANAGVHIEKFSVDFFTSSIVLGVALGLFYGKQIGVMLFSFIAVKLKISVLPTGANWREFYLASILTGIGFTMSLFIASLSFPFHPVLFDEAKVGILLGSLAAAIFAGLVIFIFRKK